MFLIGVRVNRPLRVHRWLPVARAMPAMLAELRRRPVDGKIDVEAFSAKDVEIRGRMARHTLLIEAADRGRDEHADLAKRAFEPSQRLTERWITAGHSAKRRIPKIVRLNFTLDGVTLVPERRKPFDALVGGLSVLPSRVDRI